MKAFADFLEAFVIGAVTRVENAAALVIEEEPAEASFFIAKMLPAPMMARRECHAPILVLETFPPMQLDHAFEAESICKLCHAPRHDGDSRMTRQFADRWAMKMIVMRVRNQDQIDLRKAFDLQSRVTKPFEKKNPIGEIGIHQNVQIRELN